MKENALYKERICNVIGSDGNSILLPLSVATAVIIDTLAYRASKRVPKDVQTAVKAVLRCNNPEQPTKEIAAKMLKIATHINDFWAVQCDEIKQIFLDLTARRYTEIANKHK